MKPADSGWLLRLCAWFTKEWRALRKRPRWLLGSALALPLVPLLLPATALTPASLLPPMLTLGVVLATQRVVLAMLLGVLAGSILHHGPWLAVPLGIHDYFFERLTKPTNLCITAFALSVLSTVRLAEASGGMRALVAPFQSKMRSARATMLGTSGLGLLVFFDDYANTLLIGPTLRPLADRQGISREKLAYLVDSTAAPVAGVAVVSTWLGYEVGLLDEAGQALGLSQGGYALLLLALPRRFYCLFALVLVFMIAGFGRDFGPMLKAERAAAQRLAQGQQPLEAPASASSPSPRWLWLNAALPIAVLVSATFLGFTIDGGGLSRLRSDPASLGDLTTWQTILSASRSGPFVLASAGALALLTAFATVLASRQLDLKGIGRALVSGFKTLAIPLSVLFCAWALGAVCKDLRTGEYLVTLLRGEVTPALVPLLTFLVAAAISFATGTSWGTMAILIPAALPLAHELGAMALLIPTIAAVMDGAIFGDHCSPMSDTTLLSSVACECDTLSHVWTQLPYAVLAMLVASLAYLGTVFLGASLLVTYAAGIAALALTVQLVGRPVRRVERA